MGALRSFYFLAILYLVIPVVEAVNRNNFDIVQDIEDTVILGEVMETAATQLDNNNNYKTDDSKWQTSHTSNITLMVYTSHTSYITFMVQSKEVKDVAVYTDGELETFQPTCPSPIPPRMPQMTNM